MPKNVYKRKHSNAPDHVFEKPKKKSGKSKKFLKSYKRN